MRTLFNPDGGPAPPGGLPNQTRLPPTTLPGPSNFGPVFTVGSYSGRKGTVMILSANKPAGTWNGFNIGQGAINPAWPLL